MFTGQLGNMMLLGLANVLKMLMVVFTSMEHFSIIPISPRSRPLIETPIYLPFNHADPGHYDAVIFSDAVPECNLDSAKPPKERELENTTKTCRCGKGGAKKKNRGWKRQVILCADPRRTQSILSLFYGKTRML